MMAAALAALVTPNSVGAASTFTPTRPPAVPLAVRSPYLNAWLEGGSGCILPGAWPRHWTYGVLFLSRFIKQAIADLSCRGNIMGWQGFVAVDGVAYNWMGGAPGPPSVNQVSLEYTSTKSIFRFDVGGKVILAVTFLSPVYPDDMARQSLQFSYISAKARSSDGAPHKVQIYMDVSSGMLPGVYPFCLHLCFPGGLPPC